MTSSYPVSPLSASLFQLLLDTLLGQDTKRSSEMVLADVISSQTDFKRTEKFMFAPRAAKSSLSDSANNACPDHPKCPAVHPNWFLGYYKELHP